MLLLKLLFCTLIQLPLNWMIFGFWHEIEGAGSTCWPQEREALLQFRKAATPTDRSRYLPPYHPVDTWDDEVADCCKWQGVKCDQHSGRVTELRLPTCPGKFSLSDSLPRHCYYVCSSLPPSLSRLEALQVLDVRGGCFTGDISPSTFESLTNLTHLDLSSNFLLPLPHMPLLPKLAYLNFSCNTAPSLMPQLLGNKSGFNLFDLARSLPNLRYLDLSINYPELVEPVSESLYSPHYFKIVQSEFSASPILPHLIHLDISGNMLSGVVPSQLGTLQNLTYLNLANNRLRNPLPWPSLANLSQLQHLELGNTLDDDDVEVLTWEESQTHEWPCKWKALQWLSFHNMRFVSDDSTPFCLEQPAIISKLTYLSIWSHRGSIAPLLRSLSSANTSLHLQYLLLPGASLGEVIQASWLSPLDTPFLESLDVSHNALTSLPPAWLPQLPRLQSLDISNNNLTQFPPCLRQLPFLKNLDISENHINVSLHQLEFHESAKLQSLTLSTNAIKGTIPPSFLLPSLSFLDLSRNHLEGGIPSSIGNLSMLSHLDLSFNLLKGSIPPSIGMSTALSYLDLSYNMLSGEIPWSVANLTALTQLYISQNNLVGVIPPHIFDLPLSSLSLSFNNLTGSLPLSLGNCGALDTLDLSNNYLSGRLPHLFKSCPVLSRISLSNNSLSGDLPETYQNCEALYTVDLSSNDLSGGLPEAMFKNCSFLYFVNLGQNLLSSKIPTAIGKLVRLEVLVLSKNGLSKEIPRALRKCKRLKVLDLSHNQLSGSIPEWLSGTNFASMVVMMLSNNELQGPIPFSLMANSTTLQIIGLANNRLSGSIPTHLDQLVGMTNPKGGAVGSYNTTSYLFTLDIAYKGTDRSLNGYILSHTVALDLSNNNLEGTIPVELGALRALILLNLSHNALTGLIPSTLGGSLESLDLSHNELEGGIPSEFCSLDDLGALDLSSNHLQGSIPTCPRLSNFDASSFKHNDGLCGLPLPNRCAEAPAAIAQALQEGHRSWFGKVQDCMSLAALGIGYAVGLLLTICFLNR